MPSELLEVNHGTDGEPEPTQPIQINRGFDSLANVPRGLTMPHDVGEIGRCVIEGSSSNTGIVRACNKCIAGTEAGSDHAELLVPLLLQPIEAAPDIDDALADGVERAPDVR